MNQELPGVSQNPKRVVEIPPGTSRRPPGDEPRMTLIHGSDEGKQIPHGEEFFS